VHDDMAEGPLAVRTRPVGGAGRRLRGTVAFGQGSRVEGLRRVLDQGGEFGQALGGGLLIGARGLHTTSAGTIGAVVLAPERGGPPHQTRVRLTPGPLLRP